MLELNEMIIDAENQKVYVGRKIDIDPLQIESVMPVTIWEFNKYLPEEEKNKISPERLENMGSVIKMCDSNSYYAVMESKNYINGIIATY